MSGWVYLIQAGEYTKIGIATSVKARMANLQTGHPRALVLRGAVLCADAGWAEAQMHQLFSAKRVRGEWFLLTDEDASQALIALESYPKPAQRELIEQKPEPAPKPEPKPRKKWWGSDAQKTGGWTINGWRIEQMGQGRRGSYQESANANLFDDGNLCLRSKGGGRFAYFIGIVQQTELGYVVGRIDG